MGLGCTKHVQVPGPLCLREPHPQNTPTASIPPQDSAKIGLLLLPEQLLPSRACAGGVARVSWGSLHPQSPSHRTGSPCQ